MIRQFSSRDSFTFLSSSVLMSDCRNRNFSRKQLSLFLRLVIFGEHPVDMSRSMPWGGDRVLVKDTKYSEREI